MSELSCRASLNAYEVTADKAAAGVGFCLLLIKLWASSPAAHPPAHAAANYEQYMQATEQG